MLCFSHTKVLMTISWPLKENLNHILLLQGLQNHRFPPFTLSWTEKFGLVMCHVHPWVCDDLFSFIGNSTLRSLNASGTPSAWPSLNPYRITPIHWLMARRRLWRNDVVRSYWQMRHPLLWFLCLHEAVTLPFVVAISDPTTTLAIIHLHFGDCLSGTLFSSRWSAMEFRRCIPPCARFIAREDPHSKCILCLGFSHAREAVYGTSKCKICDDFVS